MHPTSWIVISLETSTAHRSFLGQAILSTSDLASDQARTDQHREVPTSSPSLPVSESSYPPSPLKVKAVGSRPSGLVTLGELQAGTGVRRCLCKITFRMILRYEFEFLKQERYGDIFPVLGKMETKMT